MRSNPIAVMNDLIVAPGELITDRDKSFSLGDRLVTKSLHIKIEGLLRRKVSEIRSIEILIRRIPTPVLTPSRTKPEGSAALMTTPTVITLLRIIYETLIVETTEGVLTMPAA